MTNQPQPQKPGLLTVISGPSGVGKTTITRAVINHFSAYFSISATTRPISEMETNGLDYQFINEDLFKSMINDNKLLEYAKVFDHYYGSPKEPVDKALAEGQVVILEIDVQGGIQIRKSKPDAFMIYILPPSELTLLQRLRERKRESEERIQRRFGEAKKEMTLAKTSGVYDCFVTNDNLEKTIAEVCDKIESERIRRSTPQS